MTIEELNSITLDRLLNLCMSAYNLREKAENSTEKYRANEEIVNTFCGIMSLYKALKMNYM